MSGFRGREGPLPAWWSPVEKTFPPGSGASPLPGSLLAVTLRAVVVRRPRCWGLPLQVPRYLWGTSRMVPRRAVTWGAPPHQAETLA